MKPLIRNAKRHALTYLYYQHLLILKSDFFTLQADTYKSYPSPLFLHWKHKEYLQYQNIFPLVGHVIVDLKISAL